MIVRKPTVNFQDQRGIIMDILAGEPIDTITMITFNPGVVRANHYHKETIQWNYVLKGSIRIVTQKVGEAERQEVDLHQGDLACTLPQEMHALQALDEAVLLVFTKGPRSGEHYEDDTFRLAIPLLVQA